MNRSLRIIKLGTECVDKATQLPGTVTHAICNMGASVSYLFQPKGLDNDRQPLHKLHLEEARLDVDDADFETMEVPFDILGTIVTNKPSGFSGMAIQFVKHINGCFHVVIQPEGLVERTKEPVAPREFDLRECSGEMIVEPSAVELEESKEHNPSPTGDRLSSRIPDLSSGLAGRMF